MILIFSSPIQAIKGWRHKHLIKSTPVLSGTEHLRMNVHALRQIHYNRIRCKLIGHLWEIEDIDTGSDDDPYTFGMICWRCFPHIESTRVVQSYNLFAISEKDID